MMVSIKERAETQLGYWDNNISEKILWDTETIDLIGRIYDTGRASSHDIDVLEYCENSRSTGK